MDIFLGFIALLGTGIFAVGLMIFFTKIVQKKSKKKALIIMVTGFMIFLTAGLVGEENSNETVINNEESSLSSLKEGESEEHEAVKTGGTKDHQQEELIPITKEEFNTKFELDNEETQYENGKFIFADGSITTADYLQYKESDLFDYAMAVFENSKLASIQIESKKGINKDKVLEELGLHQKAVIVEQSEIGKKTGIYDIVVDKKYKEGNVKRYPFELD